ncbi:hypothetical protein MHYP_G00141360 [Metynnis hypsauchen]
MRGAEPLYSCECQRDRARASVRARARAHALIETVETSQGSSACRPGALWTGMTYHVSTEEADLLQYGGRGNRWLRRSQIEIRLKVKINKQLVRLEVRARLTVPHFQDQVQKDS